MNNPFASNRNIFNNIIKPTRTVQPDKQADTNNNMGNNTSNNAISHTKTYSNVNANSSNLGGGIGGIGGIGGVNNGNSLSGNKIDLNFRNQFRTSTTSVGNMVNTNINTSPNDPRKQPTINDNTLTNPNTQTKLISDKQYPSYQPQSSVTPSLSIPINSTSMPNTKYNTNNNNTNNSNPNINVNSYQSISSSKFGMQSQPAIVSGVQRQKFTFGVGSVTENKLEYDRNKFVNRQQFNAMPSSSINSINSMNSNHRMTNTPIPREPSTGNMIPSPNKQQHISMSPIQQHSRHRIDDIQQQFLDIDAMGDDIEKILASSKNQDELYRLLGIENVGDKSERVNGNTQANMYSTNTNANMYATNPNKHNPTNTNPNIYNNNNNNMYNTNNNIPQHYNPTTNTNTNTNYHSRSNIPNQPQNYNNIPTQSHAAHNYNNYINEEHYDRDEQVFNYEIENVYNKNIGKNMNSNKLGSSQNISIGASTSNYMQPSQNNTGLASTTSYQAHNSKSNTNNNYTHELQTAIDNQLKKLSTNGKYRTFLSASDKIQTVKYQMEYI